MDIADFIRIKRLEQGITQRQLAEYAEVSFTFVNRIENGDLNVQVHTLNKVLNVFGHELGPVGKNPIRILSEEVHE